MKHQDKIAKKTWHSVEIKEIFEELKTSKEGLSSQEVKQRLVIYGENKLPIGKKITWLQIVLHQLLNPLIFILLIAAMASIAIGEGEDAVFIFLVILINCALGAYQEYNAEKSAAALQNLLKIKAKVRRSKEEAEISSEAIVPGDIVLLESGVKVPADIRLVEESSLKIDESLLTGESIATTKQTKTLENDLGVGERSNMAFAGSTVINGRGWGIVVSTGTHTEVGKISRNLKQAESAKPPLVQRMEKFIKQISILIIMLSLIIGVILYFQEMDLISIFFLIVALVVAAIPEGLPVALTVVLSIATQRMAKRNVIVRKLTSVESLGSCTVIASDKTGTLTVNEQTAKRIILPDGTRFKIKGEGYNGDGKVYKKNEPQQKILFSQNRELQKIGSIAVLANEALLKKENSTWIYHGDAIDVALLGMSFKLGLNPEEFLSHQEHIVRIPYESERKFSAAFCSKKNNIYLKGAVETVLDFCDSMSLEGSFVALDKDLVLKQSERMARKGYRVLAFAHGEHGFLQKKKEYKNEDIPPLTFYGLVGFIDPLRQEAIEAIEQCKKAGIKVIMITGDHPSTAKTLAQELGISDKKTKVVAGKMLSQANPPDSDGYEKLVLSSSVFARVSPIQKLEIVDVLIRHGEFVAVTGDGVNDAPALKRANIGVAMGSGTDLAKEVGAMIIVDDNFSSIVAGVEEGRFAYDNVRKVIYLLISTGAAEIILFITSILAGLPLPLLAVQLLWLNLVTNGIQHVALAFEKGDKRTMKKKPRSPSEKIFNPLMVNQTLVSSTTMGLIVFGLWLWLNKYTQMEQTHARNLLLLLMVFMENFHVFNCRSERVSTFKISLKRNIMLVFGVLAAQGIHILSMHIPYMQNILHIAPVSLKNWLYTLSLAIPVILVMELFKYLHGKMGKKF